jgi:asparagine synthase (glutamine-hydrolysing)
MCGICGFTFDDKELLKRMINTLSHRGPDDRGHFVDGEISLGHTRLSIIDLSGRGRQPMSNEDGGLWITYNGEIYNYIELREELKNAGHKFSSESDTEAILHAYEEYNFDFVNKLRGMFAFALWDSEDKRLILARDPIGKKPLYYYFDGRMLIFASEIKAILESKVKRQINRDALCSYLAFQYTVGTQTMFQGIKKVMGGQMLVFDFSKEKINMKKIQYWDIRENVINKPERYHIDKLKALLEESANLRLRSDVPVGAFLSGGIDSSVAVAFARDKVDYDFHTFSVGFETFSELEYARKVAEHFDTEHHEIVINGHDVIKHFSKIAWHFDEPVGDAAIIANYFLSREARKYVKVVLAGEAGDELFAGYPNYRFNLQFYRLFKIPYILRKPFKFLTPFSPALPQPWKRRLRFFSECISQPDFGLAHYHTTGGLREAEVKDLTKMGHIDLNKSIILPEKLPKEPLNIMLVIDCKNLLPEKYLMKADKATMANGVEERLVLLDKKIVEFAFSVPPELKIKNGRGKYILRKAAEGKLPKEILWRKKQGFAVPIGDWIKGEMKDYILQKLEGEFLHKEFQPEAIKRIADNVKKRNLNNYHQSVVVWTLFALEEWYGKYFRDME